MNFIIKEKFNNFTSFEKYAIISHLKPKLMSEKENFQFSLISTEDTTDEPEYTAHGYAHWLSNRSKENLTDSVSGRPTGNGLWIGGGFFHHKQGNLISIAPPGTGKGAALIIPNLLLKRNYPHSFVVFDPKGTNACITAGFQKDCGRDVFIGYTNDIDPSSPI